MARRQKYRRICNKPDYDNFLPAGILSDDCINLTLDEYEMIRLIDFEKLTHEQCANQMQISRTTVTEAYGKARYKIANCLVNGIPLFISGGNYHICDKKTDYCKNCCKSFEISKNIISKGENIMRVAVTYKDGEIFQHFGHSEFFKFYDIENGIISKTQVVDTMGSGHGALAGFLVQNQVDILICGGIGGGAQSAISEAGIKLYGGVNGNADEAVNMLMNERLQFNPEVRCSHHNHEHSCGKHNCKEDKHGCTGNKG